MRRLSDQRGAIAISSALLAVLLVGMAALAIDASSLWWDKKQVQNGADAAALALAQSCAQGTCEANEQAMATSYVQGNKNDTNAIVTKIDHDVVAPTPSVTVTVSTTRTHWFAVVFGQSSSTVTAVATASWGAVGSASVLPFVVGDCQLSAIDSGGTVTLWTKAPGGAPNCSLSSGNGITGTFGWLDDPDSDCRVETSVDGTVLGRTGDPGPTLSATACDTLLRDLHGREILLPIFDSYTGFGSNVEFHLSGYAVIRIDTYCLNAQKDWGYPLSGCKSESEKWINGTFITKVALGETIGGPDHGATTVQLTG